MIPNTSRSVRRRVYKKPMVLRNIMSPKNVYMVLVIDLSYCGLGKELVNMFGRKLSVRSWALERA